MVGEAGRRLVFGYGLSVIPLLFVSLDSAALSDGRSETRPPPSRKTPGDDVSRPLPFHPDDFHRWLGKSGITGDA